MILLTPDLDILLVPEVDQYYGPQHREEEPTLLSVLLDTATEAPELRIRQVWHSQPASQTEEGLRLV